MNIFVFGSNREGRHGAGAALEAKKNHRAIYGQAKGRQGNSYAIVTKELRHYMPAVTLSEIEEQVHNFLIYAKTCNKDTFNVSPIGCGLAGFTPKQIAPLFAGHSENVILPPEFLGVLNAKV